MCDRIVPSHCPSAVGCTELEPLGFGSRPFTRQPRTGGGVETKGLFFGLVAFSVWSVERIAANWRIAHRRWVARGPLSTGRMGVVTRDGPRRSISSDQTLSANPDVNACGCGKKYS